MKRLALIGLIFMPLCLSAQDTLLLENIHWELQKGYDEAAETLLQINPTEGTFDASNVTLSEILQTAFQLPAKRRVIASSPAVEAALGEIFSLTFRCPYHQLSNFDGTLQSLLALSIPLQVKSFKKKEQVQILRQIPGNESSLKALDLSKPMRSSADLAAGKFEGFNTTNLVAFLENYLNKTTIDRTAVDGFVDIKLQVSDASGIPSVLKKMGLKLNSEDYFATYISVKELD